MTGVLDFHVRQEADRVDSRSLLHVGIASIVVGAIGVFFAGVILAIDIGGLQADEAGPEGTRASGRTLSQVEQTPIWTTRVGLDLRERQRHDLQRWGWVDRKAGIATIPIDRAMDIVASETSR